MSEFDAIVVGAGNAGSAAAYVMAKSGLNVLLVDRGDPPGTKNLSGGVLWGNDLAQIIPNWAKEAPIERYITNKKIGFLTEESSTYIDFRTKFFEKEKVAYSLLRAKFDPWFAKKAREAGALVIPGITVEKLVFKDKKVIGIEQGGDVITGDVVLLADGINSRLSIEAGIRRPMRDEDVSIGIKEIIKLSSQKIEDRFNLKNGEGTAIEYLLGFAKDLRAAGFLYTNKDSISLGVVIPLEALRKRGDFQAYDLIEIFKEHPSIEPLIDGGKPAEYGAHLIPESGLDLAERIYGDGYLLLGDAAGFAFSNGLVLQGMNYAIVSGIKAAETVIEAKKKNNFSSSMLSLYETKLNETYVLKDMRRFRSIRKVLTDPYLYEVFPTLLERTLLEIYWERGLPKKKVSEIFSTCTRAIGTGYGEMLTELIKIYRRL